MKNAPRAVALCLLFVVLTGIVYAQTLPPTFDLRNVNGEDYVTSIKGQQGGTCWTFGAMSAIEGNLMMTGVWKMNNEVGEPNLAEYHLDWWNGFNRYNNDDTDPPTGGGLTVHYGGDYLVTAAYLARGEGAVRDVDGQNYLVPPERSDPYFHFYYTPTIEWYTAGSDLSNIDTIKQVIMDHGVVGTAMCYSGSFMNSQFEHYQPPSNPSLPNHAISIIGWDDNRNTQASKNGAWLCKNSWGPAWGNGGFFWISYYDKVCCQHPEMGAISYQDVEPMPYDYIYQHDYHGWRDTKTDVFEAFNAFVAEAPADEMLHAVSFYTADDDVAYVASVYDRFESGELKDLLATKTGVIVHRGLHTIDLDAPLMLSPGQDFFVYLHLDKGGHPFDRTSEVPVLLGASARVTVESSASPGESYYMDNGVWKDFYEFNDTANFCMKALTAIEPPVHIGLPNHVPEGPLPLGVEVPITVEITPGMENCLPTSGKLHYRFHSDDPFSTVPMTHLGGDLYEAMIPHTVPMAKPEYYFSAEGDLGGVTFKPKLAPVEFYSFTVYLREIMLVDDMETETGWKVRSYNMLDGEWERADPEGSSTQPEDDHSDDGTQCWVTGAKSADDDLDGGPTYLTSPSIDLSNGDAVLSFWVWFHHSSTGQQQPLKVSIANNGLSFMPVEFIKHSPQWTYHEYKVSDIVEPSSNVQIEICAWDNPNDSTVEALIDDFKVEYLNYNPTLWADGYEISASAGAAIRFSLGAGVENAGRKYMLLGSLSGTLPGFTLPGGEVLPLNWDLFTDLLLQLTGTPLCKDFQGVLDGQGASTAVLNAPGALNPSVVGLTANFAYLLLHPPAWDFTSNPIDVTFEP